ncbi:MAG: transposase, partial [Clostridia bacterium]|nr:transposase [Clostridia bacterium]
MQRRSHKNKKYSIELKTLAVQDYLAGTGSQREICKKYGILRHSQLQQWILWYNGHKEIKRHNSAKGEIYMTKGR